VGDPHRRLDPAAHARHGQRLGETLPKRDRVDLHAVARLDPVKRREVDLGVARLAVEPAADPGDQAVDGAVVVGHPRGHLGLLLAAGQVARDAGDDVALAALGHRLVDHPGYVGVYAGVLGGEPEVLAGVDHRDRPFERLAQLPPDQATRLVDLHAPHVDPGDGHALRDHVVARRIVRVSGDRTSDQDQQEDGHEDERLLPHASVGGGLPRCHQSTEASGVLLSVTVRLRES
jgi:hypothetical protein